MKVELIDRTAFLHMANATHAATSGILKVDLDHILEALAFALGCQSWAALNAKFRSDPNWHPERYDHFGFIKRLHALICVKLSARYEEQELEAERKNKLLADVEKNALDTAEAVAVLLEGARLNISIEKRPSGQQRTDKYDDVAFDAEVCVTGLPQVELATEQWFLLPKFSGQRAASITIDSSNDFRMALPRDLLVTRNQGGLKSGTAALKKGIWRGGVYIYNGRKSDVDPRIITNIKTALARNILPIFSRNLYLRVFHPDRYHADAHRVELTYGPALLGDFASDQFTFDMNLGGTRWIHASKVNLTFGDDENPRGLVHNGTWVGEIYPRSGPQTSGLISITAVRLKLLESAYCAVQSAPEAVTR